MKFAIAVHGTRGDIEPAAAVARTLLSRGHDVRLAVPPNLIGFVETAGLPLSASYGPDSHLQLESEVFRNWWKLRNPITALQKARAYVMEGWADMNHTLTRLAEGADLILTGTTYQEVAANVAEAKGIPFAALHYFPVRANHHILPVRLPERVIDGVWAAAEWGHWRLLKPAYDAQRARLALPKVRVRAGRHIVEQGALEIQAYDQVFFPGLEDKWHGRRPVVGALSLEMPTPADESVSAWIRSGRPPLYFGFGSMRFDNAREVMTMVAHVCRELGERAVICSGSLAVEGSVASDDVIVVPAVSHAKIFPLCRAIIHHGGAGTTGASVRSGVPTLVLWIGADQPIWAAQVRRLGVGTSSRFTDTTAQTLLTALHTVLGPRCVARAREVAAQITPLPASLELTADILEERAMCRSSRLDGRYNGVCLSVVGAQCG